MFKKPIQKENKTDLDIEPKLVNKISPRSKVLQQQTSQEPISNNSKLVSQSSSGVSTQKNKGRSSIHEIVSILQHPILFQIVSNQQKGNKQSNTNSNTQSDDIKNQGRKQSSSSSTSSNNDNYLTPAIPNVSQYPTESNTFKNQQPSNHPIVIAENEIPNYIEKSIESGLNYLNQNMLKEAVYQLRSAEVLIDKYMVEDGRISTELMLGVVMNLGICFYKASLFDEAYSCFENCDLRIKAECNESGEQQIDSDTEENEDQEKQSNQQILSLISQGKIGDYLKKIRLRLQLNLQMCILFSEVGKHEDSLDYARKSAKLSIHLVLDTLAASYGLLISAYLPSQQFTSQQITKLIEKVLKTLHDLEETRKPGYYRKRARSEYGNIQEIPQNKQQSEKDSNINTKGTESPSPQFKKPRSASTKITEKLGVHVNHIESISIGLRDILSKGQNNTLKDEDIQLLLKTIPVLNYVCAVFASLKGKIAQGLQDKCRINESLRIMLEQLMISNVSQNKTTGNNNTTSNLRGILSVSSQQLDMGFITNTVKDQHWLISSNILNLLQLKPVQLADITAKRSAIMEIQPEDTLRKIVDTAISFYCISTETRFVEESSFLQPSPLSFKLSDSEFWLGKSLEIAYALIPQDAPMISQIINVFTRFHGVEKQIIPEVEEIVEQVKLLRPQKGVNITSSAVSALKNNFFIPAIRTLIPKSHRTATSQQLRDSHSQQYLHDTSDMREESTQRTRVKVHTLEKEQDLLGLQENKQEKQLIDQEIDAARNSEISRKMSESDKISENITGKEQQSQKISDMKSIKISKNTDNNNTKINVDTAVSPTSGTFPSSKLSDMVVFIEKTEEMQLKREEQFLNQQKYYQQGCFPVDSQLSSPPQKQVVFDKIQALVNKQRPQSSEQSRDSNLNNNNSNNLGNNILLNRPLQEGNQINKLNISNTSGNKENSTVNKVIPERNRTFSLNLNLLNQNTNNINNADIFNHTHGNIENVQQEGDQQLNLTQLKETTNFKTIPSKLKGNKNESRKDSIDNHQLGITSDQHCFTEPAASSNSSQAVWNNNVNLSKEKRYKTYNLAKDTQQTKKSPQVGQKSQQQQSSLLNSIPASSLASPQVEPANSFLKSFNSFFKQIMVQDEQKQSGQKKTKEITNPSTTILNQNIPQSFDGIPQAPKQKRKTQMGNLDHHRISLPDSFATGKATIKKTNTHNNNNTMNNNNSNYQRTFTESDVISNHNNMEVTYDDQRSHSNNNNNNQYDDRMNNNINNKNQILLSLMPSRRSSQPQNNLGNQVITPGGSNKPNRCGSQEKERRFRRALSGNRQACMMTINTNFNDMNGNCFDVVDTKEQGGKHILEMDLLSRSSCKRKRTHSASNPKTGQSSASTKSAASTQPFTSPSSTIQSDAIPLKNNFISNNNNNTKKGKQEQQQQLTLQQLQSFTVQLPQKKQTTQQQQVLSSQQQEQQMNLANQFSQQQQALQQAQLNILTALQQNSVISSQLQKSNGILSNSIEINTKTNNNSNNTIRQSQTHKRKQSANANITIKAPNNIIPNATTTSNTSPWMFNDKLFTLASLKSPTSLILHPSNTNTNDLPFQSPQHCFEQSIPSPFIPTTTPKLKTIPKQQKSQQYPQMLDSKIIFPVKSTSSNQQRNNSAQRQTRMQTDMGNVTQQNKMLMVSGESNKIVINNNNNSVNINRLHTSGEERPRTSSHMQYSRLKTML